MILGKDSPYSSNAGYFYVNFYINGSREKVFESNWKQIRINNNMERHFPLVFIDLLIDNQVFIEKNIYPQKELQLQIFYADENNTIMSQPMIFDLIVMEVNIDLPQKFINNVSNPGNLDFQRHTSTLTCIPKQCHDLLNVTVNAMWEDPVSVKGATMNVISEVVDTSGRDKNVDTRKMNGTVLEQFIIPPMSFKNALRYIDETCGIYNGKLFYYVNYQGTFFMWELKRKWDDFGYGGLYTVHKMPCYSNCCSMYKTAAQLARTTPNNYVVYDNMKTICMPNDRFVPDGGTQLHVFHPNWDISKLVVSDPLGLADSDGIHSNKHDLKTHSILKKRIVSFDNTICDENGAGYNTYIKANYIEPAYKSNYLYLTIRRKFKPHIVMQVGQPFFLQMYSEQEKFKNSSYSGKYLITESIFKITRDQGPDSGHDTVFGTCDIVGVRTSQTDN